MFFIAVAGAEGFHVDIGDVVLRPYNIATSLVAVVAPGEAVLVERMEYLGT